MAISQWPCRTHSRQLTRIGDVCYSRSAAAKPPVSYPPHFRHSALIQTERLQTTETRRRPRESGGRCRFTQRFGNRPLAAPAFAGDGLKNVLSPPQSRPFAATENNPFLN